MTLRRALHVTLKDDDGSAASFPDPESAPGSSADHPIYTRGTDEATITRPEASSFEELVALTVSTSSVRLVRSNTARRALVICNNGSGSLYVGNRNTVTSSGAGMGLKVPSGGRYMDSGDGVFIGELWGIYSAAATTQNVAVSDRS